MNIIYNSFYCGVHSIPFNTVNWGCAIAWPFCFLFNELSYSVYNNTLRFHGEYFIFALCKYIIRFTVFQPLCGISFILYKSDCFCYIKACRFKTDGVHLLFFLFHIVGDYDYFSK